MEIVFPKLFTTAYSKGVLRDWGLARLTNEQEIVINLSKCEFITPFGITVLAGIMNELLVRTKTVSYVPPTHRGMRKFLTRIGFVKFFQLREELTQIYDTAVQLRRLQNLDPSYIDQIIRVFETNLRLSPGVKGLLKLSINETMMNVFEFSSSQLGCYVCAQMYRNAHQIRVCITDFGIGILGSLRNNPKYAGLTESSQAIKLAVEEGVTSRPSGVGGKGLYTLQSFLKVNRGRMVVISGDAKILWDFWKGKQPSENIMDIPFEGTIVAMRIRTDREGVYVLQDGIPENVIF